MAPRFERKYHITSRTRDFLRAQWGARLLRAPFTDAHAVYPVLSQYYDSPELDFYHEKLDGIARRRKIRLRVYGYRFERGMTAFLESKDRRSETISKRRVQLPDFGPELLDPSAWFDLDLPGLATFSRFHHARQLRATAQVLYLREAYEVAEDPGLRITFDSHLVGLHPGEVLTRDVLYDGSRAILPDDAVILEIKSPARLPDWIVRGIRWCELQQETVPKYVMAMDALGLVRLNSVVMA